MTSALSVVLSNTPREPHELPATLRAGGGSGVGYAGGIAGLGLSWAGMRGHGRSGAEAEVVVKDSSGAEAEVVCTGWVYLGRMLRSIG